MAAGQLVSIISFLVTLGAGPSVAISSQDLSTDVKACKAISDDKDRLKCFDRLLAEPEKSHTSPEVSKGNWTIDESRSPDGSPDVVAANLVGDVVLILRCKNQITVAAFSTQYNYLGYKSVDVQLRINDQNPIKHVWNASVNGRAAFAPDAIAFIESLPDNGSFSIKTTRSTDGKVKEAHFSLGAVSEVSAKIAKACDWADGPVDEPVGSIDPQEKR